MPNNKLLLLILVGIYFIIVSRLFFYFERSADNNLNNYALGRANEFKIALKATLHHYQLIADNYYEQISSDSLLIQSLHSAAASNLLEKLKYRETALQILQKFKPQLEIYKINCLNIYFKDNQTFIRLNNPELMDYNAGIAPSLVSTVNHTLKKLHGFETGPASAGFRFVYPLMHKDHHCGCLELGVDLIGLREILKSTFPFEFRFLINKNLLLSKTPFHLLQNFRLSDLSEDFVYEKSSLTHFESDTSAVRIPQSAIIEFNKRYKQIIKDKLITRQDFGVAGTIDDKNILALFVKINSPDPKDDAYVIIYSNDTTAVSFKKNAWQQWLGYALIILLLLSVGYYAFQKHLEVKRKNAELQAQTEQLSALNKTKDKFFSVIAHDLRNPFHGLVGLTQVLVEDYDKLEIEKVKRYHELIYQSAKQGYQLVVNLLEWIRTQTGRITFNPEKINLSKVISDNITMAKSTAQNKNIRLINLLDPKIIIEADYNMIHTIFRNLISNAIKFSNEGTKVIVDGMVKDGYAYIHVKDEGIGMDEDTLKNLFNLEVSQSSRGTAGESGTGLGLLLCKEFVSMHKGEIKVESQKNKGTTFTVILPMSISEESSINV